MECMTMNCAKHTGILTASEQSRATKLNFRFTERRKKLYRDESEHSLKTFPYTVGGIVYCSDISTSVTEIEAYGARTFNVAASTAFD